ncbi:MAG: hypothetical protein KKD17_02135 [Nanoarchaeota archaeon]|nr:hypothetical protein [Nanoarchaeota archaeon]
MSDDPFADLEQFLDRPIPSPQQDSDVQFMYDDRYPSLLLRYIINDGCVHLRPIMITGYEGRQTIYPVKEL